MMSLEKLTSPDYHIFFEKVRLFYDITWKFELALISRWEVSTKTRQFLYIHLKIQRAPVIMIQSFRKNILDLMKSLENLNYPYYHELTFSQKWDSFAELIWRTAPIIPGWYFCSKRQFWWCHLKFWTGAIITCWHFCKTKAFFDDVT